MMEAVFPDASQNISYSYDNGDDARGKLTSVSDSSGSSAFQYNASGQVTQETRIIDGRTYTTQYAYDPVTADLQTVTYPSGLAVTYQRDGNGRISGITAGGQTLAGNVSYLPFGPANGMTLGSVPVTRTFNQRYLLTGITAGSVMNLSYDYDGAGNVRRVNGLPRPPLVPGTTDYSYTANRLVSSSGLSAKSYSYDNVGNIVSDGVRSFVYDQSNRLIRVTKSGVVLGEYAYDAFNRRVKKIVDGKTTHFHYDANGQLICETDASGNTIRDYVYLNGEPVAMRVSGSWYWFLCDHLGTPQKLIDNSGNLVWEAAYLPFGKARVLVAIIENNLRFPGQYFDEETGLHYNWHRYYDPESGRYWTADPIGLAGGVNLYVYASNNPVIVIDPNGEFGIVGAIAGSAIEFGVQMALNGGNIHDIDWVDVAMMGAVGAVVPSSLGSASKIFKSYKATKVISSQLSRAKAASKITKLNGRISHHKSIIKSELAIQGAIAVGKFVAKRLINDPEGSENSCHGTNK